MAFSVSCMGKGLPSTHQFPTHGRLPVSVRTADVAGSRMPSVDRSLARFHSMRNFGMWSFPSFWGHGKLHWLKPFFSRFPLGRPAPVYPSGGFQTRFPGQGRMSERICPGAYERCGQGRSHRGIRHAGWGAHSQISSSWRGNRTYGRKRRCSTRQPRFVPSSFRSCASTPTVRRWADSRTDVPIAGTRLLRRCECTSIVFHTDIFVPGSFASSRSCLSFHPPSPTTSPPSMHRTTPPLHRRCGCYSHVGPGPALDLPGVSPSAPTTPHDHLHRPFPPIDAGSSVLDRPMDPLGPSDLTLVG